MSKNYGAGKYLYKVVIALDQLFNTLLCGWPEETLSSRTYRCAHLVQHIKKRWIIAEKVINTIFFWQKSHCKSAYETELAKKHSPQ